MQSRVFTALLFFLTFGLFSSAAPLETTDVEKRALAVVDIIADLQVNLAVAINALVALDVHADVTADVTAIVNVFATATANLHAAGPVSLSSAQQNSIANTVASSIDSTANALARFPQTSVFLAVVANVDVQINAFLSILGVVVVGIVDIIAKININVNLLVSVHLTIIANIFINILGIIVL